MISVVSYRDNDCYFVDNSLNSLDKLGLQNLLREVKQWDEESINSWIDSLEVEGSKELEADKESLSKEAVLWEVSWKISFPKEFTDVLDSNKYSYHINNGTLIIDHEGFVNLNSLTTLPNNVQFNNRGYVSLDSLTTLPNNVQFNNEGYVYLSSLPTLPDNKEQIFKNYRYKIWYNGGNSNWTVPNRIEGSRLSWKVKRENLTRDEFLAQARPGELWKVSFGGAFHLLPTDYAYFVILEGQKFEAWADRECTSREGFAQTEYRYEKLRKDPEMRYTLLESGFQKNSWKLPSKKTVPSVTCNACSRGKYDVGDAYYCTGCSDLEYECDCPRLGEACITCGVDVYSSPLSSEEFYCVGCDHSEDECTCRFDELELMQEASMHTWQSILRRARG